MFKRNFVTLIYIAAHARICWAKGYFYAGKRDLKQPIELIPITTTEGAVVQPGSVVLTLVPLGEKLFADVAIKNEDIGFIQVGQTAMVKLAAFPFQKYGLLTGKVTRVSADATESGAANDRGNAGSGSASSAANTASTTATYKARIALDQQHLQGPTGQRLQAGAGMQVAVEIHQGRRTVLEYLLSPVSKAVQEAGREK